MGHRWIDDLDYFPAFFRRFAQNAFIRRDWAFRLAADIRRRGAGEGGAVAVAAANGFFGGRPRLFSGPCNASIARFSLSRSAMSNASM
jgi:hypothetical protein